MNVNKNTGKCIDIVNKLVLTDVSMGKCIVVIKVFIVLLYNVFVSHNTQPKLTEVQG